MMRWIVVLLAAVTTVAVVVEARVIPAEPVSMMLDAYGNPIVFLREKRSPVQPYPQRAMMFTGYYRPVRRSNAGQATGVFAQGNAVSGEAFFGGMHAPPHLHSGPQPVDEPEVSSAEAEAAPGPLDEPVNDEENDTDGQRTPHVPVEEHHHQHHQHHHQQEEEPANEEEQGPQEEERPQQEEEHHHHHHQQEGHSHHDEEQHHHHHGEADKETPQEEPENIPTEVSPVIPQDTDVSVKPPKRVPAPPKKGKKTPVVRDEEEDEEYDEDEEDEPVVPFVPFKGNKRRQQYPHLNNFFPMVFSFPGAANRAGSSGSPPGAVTAIANSYSTGKSGVASSVATAYGGSPNGKKRRAPSSEE